MRRFNSLFCVTFLALLVFLFGFLITTPEARDHGGPSLAPSLAFAVVGSGALRMRRPKLQRDFEDFVNKNAPSFFDRGLTRAARMAAFKNVLGVPSPILDTPQDRVMYTLPYVNGGTSRVYSPDIPRSLFPYWVLRLSGTFSKTEVCAGSLLTEGPLPLVSGLRVLADGEVFKEIDLTHLRVLSHHIGRGIDTNLTNITLGTDVAEAFSGRVILDWRTLRSEKPDATFFPADRYGQISVEADWGASAATSTPSLVSGGSYTGMSFPTAPTLQIVAKEILDPVQRQAQYWIQKYQQKIFSVNATAQTAAAFQLPVGEVIRGILISQYNNSPRTPISTLVAANNNIVIRANGSYRKYETTWTELIQKNQADYGIALPTGYAFIDFMDPDNGGLYKSAFDTRATGVNVLEALVDTASVANAFLQFTLVTFKPAKNFN